MSMTNQAKALNILIIEDDMLARFLVRVKLDEELLGGNIIEAANGEEALNAIEALGKAPDIILLDLHMPVLGGLAFLEAYKNAAFFEKDKIIFVLSCEESGAHYEQVMATGLVKNFFLKPFSENHSRQLRQHLNKLS